MDRFVIMKSEQEISSLFDEWNKALQSGDPDQVASLYSSEAVLLPTISSQCCKCRADIRDYFELFLRRKPKGTIDESNIRIFGDIAINSGIYTFELHPAGEASFKVQARYTFVYQWSGERWLIIEHHSSVMPETNQQ